MKNFIRNDFPDEFYKIELYNDLSSTVINGLNEAFFECDYLLKKKRQNKYQNLIAVYFPHLSKLLISYVFCKFDLTIANIKSNSGLKKLFLSNENSSIWPVNYLNIRNSNYQPIGHEYLNTLPSSRLGQLKHNLKLIYEVIKKNLDHVSENKNLPLILISPNAGFGTKTLRKALKWRVKGADLNSKIFIPLFNQQLALFFNQIKIIESKLNNYFSSKFQFDKNFLSFLELELKAYSDNNQSNKIEANLIILGSLADLKCRIIAAMAKTQDIPVISVWHGGNIGEKDEPQFGPVSQTFCDLILGYGDYGCKSLQEGSFNRGFFEKPFVIPASSEKIKRIYKNNRVKRLSKFEGKIIMYVPTSFVGSERNIPFHSIHDLAYCSWQRNMLGFIKNIMKPKQLIRKGHRKQRVNYSFILEGVDQINKLEFFDVLELPDIFIFDFPTTAFAYAAATNKPIIYFNIGLRNLMEDAKESIKKRCIYIENNPLYSEKMVLAAFEQVNKKCDNNYTTRYSLSKNLQSKEEILVDIIRKYSKV